MDPFPKKTDPAPSGSKLNILAFVLLLLAIVGIAGFVYIKNKNINLKEISISSFFNEGFHLQQSAAAPGTVSQFKFDTQEHPDFVIYKGSIVKCTSSSLVWLSQKGEQQKVSELAYSHPVLKTGGGSLLVADLGGKDFCVIRDKTVKWSQKSEETIINVSISDGGYVSVVREKKGYKGAIDVYDPSGKWIFTAVRGESNVLSAKVLPSGNRVLVNMVDTSGISPNAGLEMVTMKGDIDSTVTEENEIFPKWWSLGGEIVVASDDLIAGYDSDLKKKWKLALGNIYCVNTALGKYVIAAYEKTSAAEGAGNGNVSVSIFNSKGQTAAEYAMDHPVKGMETEGNVIALNTGREVHFINTKGKSLGIYSAKTDISSVRFFDRQRAAVITKSDITVVELK